MKNKEYVQTLLDIKKRIKVAQTKAVFSVNKELIKLYWIIGKTIIEKQKMYNWGSNFLEQLAKDLQNSFPGVSGFSRANISRMRSFYRHYEKCAQAVHKFEKLPISRIPWGHNILIFQRIKTSEVMLWYAEKTIEYGWSRQELEGYIKTKLYKREGIDLLFYHIRLRCFVVIELKATKFKPEYAGKLNFYLSAVDDLLRNKDDKPTIGLLLCKTKDKFKAEYALRDIHKPIGVAEYETKLLEALPKELRSNLPTIEEIETELEKQEVLKKVETTKEKK